MDSSHLEPAAAVHLRHGDQLTLECADGAVTIRLESGLMRSRAFWVFRPVEGPATAGVVQLFERYRRVPGSATQVQDAGGRLWIEAGPVRVEWSRGGWRDGFVYPRGRYRHSIQSAPRRAWRDRLLRLQTA